jgi:hypothetical protein
MVALRSVRDAHPRMTLKRRKRDPHKIIQAEQALAPTGRPGAGSWHDDPAGACRSLTWSFGPQQRTEPNARTFRSITYSLLQRSRAAYLSGAARNRFALRRPWRRSARACPASASCYDRFPGAKGPAGRSQNAGTPRPGGVPPPAGPLHLLNERAQLAMLAADVERRPLAVGKRLFARGVRVSEQVSYGLVARPVFGSPLDLSETPVSFAVTHVLFRTEEHLCGNSHSRQ